MRSGGKRVGFVGTGVMGAPMAAHLLDAGYEVAVYNRSPEKARALAEAGAVLCDSPGEVAPGASFVITIVGYPSDVEEVYLAPGGIMERADRGTVLIDMTTSSPALAVRMAAEAEGRGLQMLDAPVSGGERGAREARLVVMAGGSVEAFGAAESLLKVFGETVVLQGAAGSGQHAKVANQIAVAASMIGACEALAYARAAGLDPERVRATIAGGAAGSWTLSNLAPRMLAGDMTPGFYVKHFVKDLGIALDSARESGIELPGLKLASDLYLRLAISGAGESGTQALYESYLAGA
ncbi:MAG: NAD(P)-dependent oxidoreductase [Coriobacteriia bacterium]|nr:NAD(P)-dependent oxidoreductase [Coriobacteriia bacterium]